MNTQDAINDFLTDRRDRNCSAKTLTWYGERLRHLAELPELPLQAAVLRAFISRGGREPESRHGTYRALHAFYTWLREERRIKTNPMELVKAPIVRQKIMPTLDPADVWKIREAAKKMETPERDLALVTLLLDSGMRAGEAAGLRFQDIGPFSPKVRGKTGEREKPISPETRLLLEALHDGSRQYVFKGTRGKMTASGIYFIWRRLMSTAGIEGPKLGPHRVRHAFARHWLRSGGDLNSLADTLGISLAVAARYARLFVSPDLIVKHRRHSLLKAATGQGALFDTDVLEQAEEILKGGL